MVDADAAGPIFQWPGAIPLSQWVRETAGFDIDCGRQQFWIIAEPTQLGIVDRSCRESLRSLLLTVIQQWTQHNERRSKHETTNRTNLLCHGFAWQPPHTKPIQKHLNAAVDYWISSPDTIALHRAIGDNLLRYIWRFPVLQGLAHNAWQICGAPLHWKTHKRQPQRKEEQSRKRQRFEYRAVKVPKSLHPQFCLFRRNLLYKNIFTKKVGQGTRLDSFETPDMLLRAMLSESDSSKEHSVDALLLEGRWKPICEQILRNHARLDYHRILERFLPLPKDYKELSLPDLAQAYYSGNDVTKFCQAVLSKLLPDDFWGHTKNQEYFLNRTLPIICTLRRHDRFPNHRLMCGLHVKQIKWLQSNDAVSSRNAHALLQQRVLSALRWWIQRYLWDLLPRVCYATDTEFLGKQDIVYYRNPVWALIRNHALQSLHQYQRLEAYPESTPVSRLRLVPKATGVRPIATLNESDVIDQKSANSALTDAFTVLSHCICPEDSYGAGMQGMHELHGRYREYLVNNASKKLYFCSVDIRHCYDNIQVEHLLKLLKEKVLEQSEYLIQKYFVMFPNRTIKKRTIVGRPGDFQPFAKGLEDWQSEFENGVFIDGVQQVVVSSKDIMESIRKHFEANTVVVKGKYGDRFFRQIKGIPQGSIISTLSCNVYYGDMEQRLGVQSNEFSESLLARMMDDFLFISTDPSERDTFHNRMSKGIPSKGVEIHPDKTQLSHDGLFAWCGFLFDTDTGEVRLDYSRFHNGVVSGSLTVDFRNPGEHLLSQMQSFCRPRCIPLLFDRAINSHSNCIYNLYQLMAFASVKTVLYNLQATNESFLSAALDQMFQYSYRLIESRLGSSKSVDGVPFLEHQVAHWLACKAWNDVTWRRSGWKQLPLPKISRPRRRRMLERIAASACVDLEVEKLMQVT